MLNEMQFSWKSSFGCLTNGAYFDQMAIFYVMCDKRN